MVGQATLDIVAGLNAASGRYDEAMQLFGAAEAQAERSGLRRDSADAAFLMPLIESARRALGSAAPAMQAEGSFWPYEEAIRRASEQLQPSGHMTGPAATPD
jgi:hypothetical protein